MPGDLVPSREHLERERNISSLDKQGCNICLETGKQSDSWLIIGWNTI